MKAATISEIKNSLSNCTPKELTELCLRLARFKKDNKELLTYLLFEADDIQTYIAHVKTEIDEEMEQINKSNLYYAKKSLRKILRISNKHIKYTASKEAEVEILLHYCSALKESGIKITKSTALTKLYEGQLKKIKAAIGQLHEDLQYEYLRQLEKL